MSDRAARTRTPEQVARLRRYLRRGGGATVSMTAVPRSGGATLTRSDVGAVEIVTTTNSEPQRRPRG